MKMIPSKPLDPAYGTEWYVSDDGDVWLMKHRVLFGYRIRAGFIDQLQSWCELDICCGAKKEDYEQMKNKIITIMEYNVANDQDPFKGIPPHSQIKPYFNDPEFLNRIDDLYQAAVQTKTEGAISDGQPRKQVRSY